MSRWRNTGPAFLIMQSQQPRVPVELGGKKKRLRHHTEMSTLTVLNTRPGCRVSYSTPKRAVGLWEARDSDSLPRRKQ